MKQSERVRPAYFFMRRCKTGCVKKMTWHLSTGLKGEPYFCTVCMVTALSKEDDGQK